MIIGIVRHGQTDFNKERRIQGYTDNLLNKTGFDQAKNLGIYLKDNDTNWDHMIVSPLTRAVQTAETIGSLINLSISHTDKRFIERDFGPFEGRPIDEVFPAITEDDFRADGYESNDVLTKRILDATYSLYETYKDKKVLIVAHSHVIKALLIAAKPDIYNYHNYYVLNSSIFYFKVTPNNVELIKQYDL